MLLRCCVVVVVEYFPSHKNVVVFVFLSQLWWQLGYCNAFGYDEERLHGGSVGLGGNIGASFEEFKEMHSKYTSAGDRNTSGNGSLMRLAPVATFFAKPFNSFISSRRFFSIVDLCLNKFSLIFSSLFSHVSSSTASTASTSSSAHQKNESNEERSSRYNAGFFLRTFLFFEDRQVNESSNFKSNENCLFAIENDSSR